MKSSSKSKAILVIHGGAGALRPGQYSPELIKAHKQGLKDALLAGNKVLQDGGNALNAVVAAVVVLENNPLFNSGKGAVFNIAGKHELDASVAVSQPPSGTHLPESRRGAAVALIKTVKNPIMLARELYLDDKACPHPFVSGADAERIAGEKGLELVDEHYFDTEDRWKEHRRGLGLPEDASVDEKTAPPAYAQPIDLPDLPKGTVGAVALDCHGMLACATSTGGKTNKNIGRIGDTPSMGSGFWCSEWPAQRSLWNKLVSGDSAKSRGVAISGTGDGDFYIRNAAAYDIVARMKYKREPVRKAAAKVVAFLKTQGGDGGCIAVDHEGNFAMPVNCSAMFRGIIRPDEGAPQVAIWQHESLHSV